MRLALLDLDKTLIDGSYRLTVPEDEFCQMVRVLAGEGVLVGLCSDSSILSLRQWADCLGLTGPLIGERGAVVWDHQLRVREIVDAPSTAWLQEFRGMFLSAMSARFPGVTLVVGDATEFIRRGVTFPSMFSQVLVVNSFREASFSFFARSYSDGSSELKPDVMLLKNVAKLTDELMVSLGKKREELFWDESLEYGILIVHALATEKRRGVAFIAGRLVPQQVVMVGDSMADYLNLPEVLQFAVSNASLDYKEKCTFVSKHSFTKGVIEGLKYFL